MNLVASSSTGDIVITRQQAIAFLVSNNFPKDLAVDYANSFVDGTIEMTTTTNLPSSIYRYYSNSSNKVGKFSTNIGDYCSPAEAVQGLALPESNEATYVEQLGPNANFSQAPLILAGLVEGGAAFQYLAYDTDEFVYGEGVRTGSGEPPPPPRSIQVPNIDIEPI
jgi:hypothetical protein